METRNGINIFNTICDLEVDIGSTTKNVFHAWYDTDNEDIKSMLDWFCVLNNNNILTSSEYEEFVYLKDNGLILENEEYNQAICNLQEKYNEIFLYENNEREINFLKDELQYLSEELNNQKKVLQMQNELTKVLVKKINSEKESEEKLLVEYKTAQDNCLQLSKNLEGLLVKIHKEILKYSDLINNFDNELLISNAPWDHYNEFNQDVTTTLNSFLSSFNEQFSIVPETCKKSSQISHVSSKSAENLDDVCLCFMKAIKWFVINLIEEEKLEAELRFIKNLSNNEILSVTLDSDTFLLEEQIIIKEEKLSHLLVQIEESSSKLAIYLTNEAKIDRYNNLLTLNEKKLNHITLNVWDKFLDISANQMAYLIMLDKEKHFMDTINQFYKEISNYLVNDVQNCQKRIEMMKSVILASDTFSKLPIEQKCPLLQSAAKILQPSSSNKIIQNLMKEQSFLFHDMFKNNTTFHLESYKYIDNQIELLKLFLMSSATTQIVAIPSELVKKLKNVKINFDKQKYGMEKGIEMFNSTQKVINDKWFKFKRLLWIFFMSEPKKMLSGINELRNSLKREEEKLIT